MLKGFNLMELVKEPSKLFMIVDNKKVRFSNSCVGALAYSPFVHFLLDPAGKRMAIQVTDTKDAQAARFSKEKEQQGEKAVVVQNAAVIDVLSSFLPKESETDKFQVEGKHMEAEGAIVFDLSKAKPYLRRSRTKN